MASRRLPDGESVPETAKDNRDGTIFRGKISTEHGFQGLTIQDCRFVNR